MKNLEVIVKTDSDVVTYSILDFDSALNFCETLLKLWKLKDTTTEEEKLREKIEEELRNSDEFMEEIEHDLLGSTQYSSVDELINAVDEYDSVVRSISDELGRVM